jgi:hypothetical protein
VKKAMPLLAFAAPVALFWLLHTLVVQPERAAAEAARRRVPIQAEALPPEAVPASDGFDGDVADLITTLANGPFVGGVSDLSIEMAAPDEPVTIAFEANYAQVGRFFWNLRTLPARVKLRSVELVPASAPMVRAKLVLSVFKRRSTTPDALPASAPESRRDPFIPQTDSVGAPRSTPVRPPAPVVKSILFSASRRVALVDGRIVGVGDRVGPFQVAEIEHDTVLFVTSQGLKTRVELQRK